MKSGRYYHRLSDADKAKIVELDKQGVQRSEIALRFNAAKTTITNVIRKFNERSEG